MKRKASKFKKHNFHNTDNSEAVTMYSTKKLALKISEKDKALKRILY